jgi:hypothetical protein
MASGRDHRREGSDGGVSRGQSSARSPNAVGLAVAAPTMDQLDAGLRSLAAMLNARE